MKPTYRAIKSAFSSNADVQSNSGSVAQGSGDSSSFDKVPSKTGTSASDNFVIVPVVETKTKVDGQPPKRRGPKPDAKPALTRRQEMNRMAQRTHRMRKENYLKELETIRHNLVGMYEKACGERDEFAKENQKIREALAVHGMSHILETLSPTVESEPSSGDPSSGDSVPGQHFHTASTEMTDLSPSPLMGQCSDLAWKGKGKYVDPTEGCSLAHHSYNNTGGVDLAKLGLDFVLALEKPCMTHMPMLCAKSHTGEIGFSGHAMMISCPPASHIQNHQQDDALPAWLPDLHDADLMKLMLLSAQLRTEGEMTPVWAWATLFTHARVHELSSADIANIRDELANKVRCYGFGAVVEEFEVRDAIEKVFVGKMDTFMTYA